MHPDFWRGKRVLLTGHTGFKGAWLALWLTKLGAQVTGFALPSPTSPSLFDIANVGVSMTSVLGDIRDARLVSQVVADSEPEIVIHMAAQSLVRYSYKNPVETYHTNVLGTVHLLDAVRAAPSVRAMVNVTSDKCYENREWDWGYREDDRLGGHDPYSNSKGCAELVTASFRDSYFSPSEYGHEHHVGLASARAGNVIGGGDWSEDRLVPDIIRAFSAGKLVHIRSPRAIRPWQHVLEPLSGYLLLAERLYSDGVAYAEGWNLGPSETDARPVSWIVTRMAAEWGMGANWELDEGSQPHEAHYLKLDCSKAHAQLDWWPRWTLGKAIERIVAWHKAHDQGADMREWTLRDIDDYTNSTVSHVADASTP